MSDEPPPPSLRLKPRQRPEAENAPAAPVAGAAESEAGKLRLKPKLAPDPAAAAAVPDPAPLVPPAGAGERIRLKPRLSQEPEPAAAPAEPGPTGSAPAEPPAPEEAKIRLKIKIPEAQIEAAARAPQPPVEETPPALGAPPPFPVMRAPESAPDEAPPPVLRPIIRPGSPRPGPPPRRIPPSVLAASAQRKKVLRLVLVALVGLLVAAAVIRLAMFKCLDRAPASRVPRPPPAQPGHVVPVLAPESDALKEPAAEEPAEPVRTRPAKPRSKSGVTVTTATTDLAPGVTVTTESVQAEIEASQAFRTFVADAKISGVFQGTPPRAFINGRLIRVGETVDPSLGITFESVDPKAKSIVFKDSTGATVARRY